VAQDASIDPGRSAEGARQARAAGRLYFKGQPCQRGHDGTRLVSCGSCVHCHPYYHRRKSPAQRRRAYALKNQREKRARLALKVLAELGLAL
jgi:hypothetical protein